MAIPIKIINDVMQIISHESNCLHKLIPEQLDMQGSSNVVSYFKLTEVLTTAHAFSKNDKNAAIVIE